MDAALAGAGCRANRRVRWFYALLTLAGLMLACGSSGHLYPWALRFIPMWRAFRYPEKVMPLALLGLCVLAGLGTHRLGHRDRRLIGSVLVLALVTTLLLVGSRSDLTGLLTRLDVLGKVPDHDVVATVAAWAQGQLVVGGLALGLLGMLIAWRSRAAGWSAVALVFVQAWPLSSWVVHVASTQVLTRRSPFADALQAHLSARLERFCWDVQRLEFEEDPAGVDVAVSAKLRTEAPDMGILLGVGTSNHATPVIPAALSEVCSRTAGCASPCSRLEAAGMGIIDGENFDRVRAERELTELARDPVSGTVLFLDPLARPYASLPAIRHVPSMSEAKAELARPDRRPAEEVVMLGEGPDRAAPGGTIAARRTRPNRIEAHVDANAPGTAVLAESCSQGWRATVDGAPVPLTKADLVLCAVPVVVASMRSCSNTSPRAGPGWCGCGRFASSSRRESWCGAQPILHLTDVLGAGMEHDEPRSNQTSGAGRASEETHMKNMRKLMKKQDGQGMTEYIIIVALIAIAAIGVVTIFGDNIRKMFGASVNALAEPVDVEHGSQQGDRVFGSPEHHRLRQPEHLQLVESRSALRIGSGAPSGARALCFRAAAPQRRPKGGGAVAFLLRAWDARGRDAVTRIGADAAVEARHHPGLRHVPRGDPAADGVAARRGRLARREPLTRHLLVPVRAHPLLHHLRHLPLLGQPRVLRQLDEEPPRLLRRSHADLLYSGARLTFSFDPDGAAAMVITSIGFVIRCADFNHFSRQSFGVLQIYKSHSGLGFGKRARDLENALFYCLIALQAGSYFLGSGRLPLGALWAQLGLGFTGSSSRSSARSTCAGCSRPTAPTFASWLPWATS